MNGHPGGAEHTRRMLALSGLKPPAAILDMGAGAGETVCLLRAEGFDTVGLDKAPRSDIVLAGDLLHTDFAGGSFDAVISQCAFFVSGDVPAALREAHRLLKPGGVLLLSDVFFENPLPLLTRAGFTVSDDEDLTALWREYYIEALWRGTADCCEIPRGKCRYRMLIGRKE